MKRELLDRHFESNVTRRRVIGTGAKLAYAAPVVAATFDHLPDPGWAGFLRDWSPKVDRCRRRPSCLAEGSGEHHRQ